MNWWPAAMDTEKLVSQNEKTGRGLEDVEKGDTSTFLIGDGT